jgi:tetratricopeptide (TPR) repeat protein
VLASQLRSLGAALPGEQVDENAEVRARLQSLGYVSGSAPRKAQYTEEDDPKRLIDVDRLMMQGIELHRSGRSREAMDAYRQVIARRPDMALAYRRLAYIQWDLGAAAEAIATLQEATAKLGPDIETDIRLGTYYAETGNAKAALPLLERASTGDPGNTEALNALGIALARDGRPQEALATFERILQLDPRDAHALENIGTVHLQRGDIAAATSAFRQVLAEGPGTSRAHAGLGVVASQQGRVAEAVQHWRRAVELDPRNFDALFNLASTLARVDPAAARPYVQQFVQTAPPGFYAREIAEFRAWLSRS